MPELIAFLEEHLPSLLGLENVQPLNGLPVVAKAPPGLEIIVRNTAEEMNNHYLGIY